MIIILFFILIHSISKSKSKFLKEKSYLILKYCKSVIEYWNSQNNDRVSQFLGVHLSECRQLFEMNKNILKKYLRVFGYSVVHCKDPKTKLTIVLASKKIMEGMDSESLNFFYKVSSCDFYFNFFIYFVNTKNILYNFWGRLIQKKFDMRSNLFQIKNITRDIIGFLLLLQEILLDSYYY